MRVSTQAVLARCHRQLWNAFRQLAGSIGRIRALAVRCRRQIRSLRETTAQNAPLGSFGGHA
eukprot:4955948-Alexandrium_andersonii.AAC.1